MQCPPISPRRPCSSYWPTHPTLAVTPTTKVGLLSNSSSPSSPRECCDVWDDGGGRRGEAEENRTKFLPEKMHQQKEEEEESQHASSSSSSLGSRVQARQQLLGLAGGGGLPLSSQVEAASSCKQLLLCVRRQNTHRGRGICMTHFASHRDLHATAGLWDFWILGWGAFDLLPSSAPDSHLCAGMRDIWAKPLSSRSLLAALTSQSMRWRCHRRLT